MGSMESNSAFNNSVYKNLQLGSNFKANKPATPLTSGDAQIDTYVNKSIEYASNNVDGFFTGLNTNTHTIDRIATNQSLTSQDLFGMLNTSSLPVSGYGNAVSFGNTVGTFTQGVNPSLLNGLTSPVVDVNGNLTSNNPAAWGIIGGNTPEGAAPNGGLLPPRTMEDILKSRNAVAGPNGAVFGRANNTLGLPEPATTAPANTASFLGNTSSFYGSTGMTSKDAALAMLSQQYPDLAQLYMKDTATKPTAGLPNPEQTYTKLVTAGGGTPPSTNAMPNFMSTNNNDALSISVEKQKTLDLIAQTQNLLSQELPKDK
jgi:hypothetical protein